MKLLAKEKVPEDLSETVPEVFRKQKNTTRILSCNIQRASTIKVEAFSYLKKVKLSAEKSDFDDFYYVA